MRRAMPAIHATWRPAPHPTDQGPRAIHCAPQRELGPALENNVSSTAAITITAPTKCGALLGYRAEFFARARTAAARESIAALQASATSSAAVDRAASV